MRLAFAFVVVASCGGSEGGSVAPDAARVDGPAVPGDDAAPGIADAAGSPDAMPSTVLPTGSVTVVNPDAPCGPGAAPGAVCQNVQVMCPDIPDANVQVAIAEPAGAPSGTVFMIYGGGGQSFFDEDFPPAYLARGLRVVQVRFVAAMGNPAAWEEEPGGSIKRAACRVATLARWTFETPHGGSRKTGFCAHGHSGGSGAMGYLMAHYGMEDFFDYVMYDAGPVFSRIDHGCAPEQFGGDGRNVCPELPDGTFAYGGAAAMIDGWENTTTCGSGSAPAEDVAKWASDSVLSGGADLDYPLTPVSFWWCANNANEAAGQGSFFAEAVQSTKAMTCVTGMCNVEPPWSDPGGFAMMVDTMEDECVPRHL